MPSTPSSPRSAGTTWRGASPAECRTVRSLRCGPGSKRLPSRTPGSGGFCARRPSCCSCFSQGHSDGHPLVAMPLTEPLLSPPHCGARSDANSHGRHLKAQKKIANTKWSNLHEPLVVLVVLVVQMIYNTASLSWRVRTMHLIGWQNTWEQAPGVPATLSPRQRRTLRHRGLKNGHSRPCGRSAKNAAKCGKNHRQTS